MAISHAYQPQCAAASAEQAAHDGRRWGFPVGLFRHPRGGHIAALAAYTVSDPELIPPDVRDTDAAMHKPSAFMGWDLHQFISCDSL